MSAKDGGEPLDMFDYETRRAPLLPLNLFVRRVARTAAIAAGVVVFSLLVGSVGFHVTEGQTWLDSTLNASMLLSGMGPLDHPQSVAGKLFATIYALFSGIVFLGVAALLFAPLYHRLIHRFHLELDAGTREERE